ncbi:MAG TPA: hypothetical protein DHN33_04640 [Eubacteriaceae bacterium]|nr:hypothetical protein [Eubacteriaceae bacterium]
MLSAFIGRSRRVSLKYRYAIALIPAVLAVVFLFYISLFPQYFPTLFQENTGLTPVKHYLEYFIIALMILAFLLIYRDYQKTRRKTQVLLLSAIIVSVFSELAFTSYASVYDIYNLIGHVYKLIASYLFFRVVFIYNILQPYNKLDRAKEEIRHYATNLEEIVQQRTLDVKVANDSLMKDIEYARNIQTAIMPSKASSFDSVRFYSEYVPFEKIGGDFFGIEDLNEDYIGFHIGDVAGHGIPAAMMTIFMKQSIISKKLYQNGKMDVYSPNEVLTNLYHRYNQTDFPSEMYAVILYGLFHKKTKEIVFSSSGLNTFPLLLRKEGTIEPIEHRGFPICKFIEDFDPQYENYAIAPKSGDRLFFYTDGLIDVTNFKGESFGETRLINLIKSHRMEPSDTLTSTILDTLDRFSKGRSRRDDIHFFFMDIQ